MRVAFAGSPAPAASILRHLTRSGHEVALVVTQPDRRRGRSGRPRPTAVAEAADELGLAARRPESINDQHTVARLEAAEVGALCVVAFGQILRDPLLERWPCLNVHFSLLPAYRGAAPVERALMDGAERTGVTVMRMDAGVDTGPMAHRAELSVPPREDAGTLTGRLADAGGPLLAEALDDLERGELTLVPQPDDGVSLAPKIGPDDRPLRLDGTARAVVDHVRALAPHIGATLGIDGKSFNVWRVAPAPGADAPGGIAVVDGRLLLRCADGAVEVLELQPPGRARMATGDFLRGRRGALRLEG